MPATKQEIIDKVNLQLPDGKSILMKPLRELIIYLINQLYPTSSSTHNINPFGKLNILKIESATDDEELQPGDYVHNSLLNDNKYLIRGVYVSGDPMESTSYEPTSIKLYNPEN